MIYCARFATFCSTFICPALHQTYVLLFFLGVTTPAEWSLLRTAPSPWAELEFENIILTVPSDVVRGLDRPDELGAHWDSIMRSIADLAVIPHKFPRKERFVADVQISHGRCTWPGSCLLLVFKASSATHYMYMAVHLLYTCSHYMHLRNSVKSL